MCQLFGNSNLGNANMVVIFGPHQPQLKILHADVAETPDKHMMDKGQKTTRFIVATIRGALKGALNAPLESTTPE